MHIPVTYNKMVNHKYLKTPISHFGGFETHTHRPVAKLVLTTSVPHVDVMASIFTTRKKIFIHSEFCHGLVARVSSQDIFFSPLHEKCLLLFKPQTLLAIKGVCIHFAFNKRHKVNSLIEMYRSLKVTQVNPSRVFNKCYDESLDFVVV